LQKIVFSAIFYVNFSLFFDATCADRVPDRHPPQRTHRPERVRKLNRMSR